MDKRLVVTLEELAGLAASEGWISGTEMTH